MTFVRPPINEVGLSASFAAPELFDDYDIKRIHDLFRAEFPNIQRVAPTDGNETEISVGLPPLSMDAPSRWWFIADDDANITQLQNNYFSRSWRRTVSIDEKPSYPGFDTLLRSFESGLSTLSVYNSSRALRLPALRSCELMYDDVIPGIVEDDAFRLGEMITFWRPFASKRPMAGWQCAWLEPITLPDLEVRANLQIQFLAAGLAVENQAPRSVLRCIWKASALELPVENVGAFMRLAHDHITTRFNETITDRVRDSWI